MYKVSGNLNSAYGCPVDEPTKRNGPDMPHVTTGNRRMTNVKVGNGEYVQGIRRTDPDASMYHGSSGPQMPDMNSLPPARPLRYTPGLNCDAHLESLRPSRDSNHPAFPSGDQWKRKLIPPPNTYEGSFIDADMQQFRPSPAPPADSDPWYTSRVPEPQYFPANERLNGTQYMNNMNCGPYDQIYPQDELSRIKMRNRRFQHSCGQEMSGMGSGGGGGGGGGPMSYGMPMMQQPMYAPQGMMQQPMMMAPTQQMMQMPRQMQMQQNPIPQFDDLQMLDQELNMTRRTTRPFVPEGVGAEYGQLERQRQMMEEPVPLTPRPRVDMPTSIEQLPVPRKLPGGGSTSKQPEMQASKPRHDVNIADQIAIRSIVLGHNLSKMGKSVGGGGGGGGGGSRLGGDVAAQAAAIAASRAPPTPPPSMAGEE